mmetsp:Transcript_21841/g.34229  ORF Transcript_21841/g.34229 Transcript_21841/m.34229 type:complete len:101 (+) Transcript_21841:174-476(+)
MIGWWGSKFLSMTFGVMYPAYSSYKAIKTIEKEDDIQWLCYWVIFGLFTFIEFFLDIVLMWSDTPAPRSISKFAPVLVAASRRPKFRAAGLALAAVRVIA